MPDYNSGGFQQGEDGTIFGSPDAASNGTSMDYTHWDWKQIKAAIYGMSSGVSTEGNLARARSVADPQTLLDAANAFYHVQRTLEGVTKSLVDQAKALAGDNGPWGGSAADSFLDMMTNFSRQVKANADVLSGGSTGDHSVPHQLANNAIAFQSAQNKLAEIDNHYANRAIAMGVTPMADGLIPISLKPELVEMMRLDMLAVLNSLAHSYQVTTDTIVNPTPVTSPANNPDGSGENEGLPDPNADLSDPDLNGLGDGLGGTGSLSDLAGYPDTGLDTGLDTGSGIGGTGDLAGLDTSVDPAAYPGDLGLGDTGLGTSGLDGTGLGDLGLDELDGLDPSAFDSALNPLAFPALGNLAGLGGSGLGADGKSSLGALSTADPAAFGDTGLDDGIGAGLTDGLGTGLTEGLTSAAPSPSQLATSSGMPYLPGMGGTGAGGAGLTAEPTDASGLLDSSADPWEGEETPGGDEVGSEQGATAGGEGLGLGGMPYVPGVAGTGPGATGDRGGERSDASGLLTADTAPWEGEESEGGEAGSPEGALSGVPHLPGFTTTGITSHAASGRADTATTAQVREGTTDTAEGPAASADAESSAPAAVGSDGLPLPAHDDHAVVRKPLADDEEEDFSAWETGPGAAVALLWAVRGADEREAEPEADQRGVSGEPRSTWQPDRSGGEASTGLSTRVRADVNCGDGGPEPEEPEETPEAAEPEEEPAPRGIADLLVQHESTWGAVPGGSASAL